MINLRNCEFGFKCNANWDEMIVSENEHIRNCELCKKDVYYLRQPEELIQAMRLNQCVAISDFNSMMSPTLMRSDLIKNMHELHNSISDIDAFLYAVVDLLRKSDISKEKFCKWYDNLPQDDFSTDLLRIADDWDFYF
jgi:hypothetical protein